MACLDRLFQVTDRFGAKPYRDLVEKGDRWVTSWIIDAHLAGVRVCNPRFSRYAFFFLILVLVLSELRLLLVYGLLEVLEEIGVVLVRCIDATVRCVI